MMMMIDDCDSCVPLFFCVVSLSFCNFTYPIRSSVLKATDKNLSHIFLSVRTFYELLKSINKTGWYVHYVRVCTRSMYVITSTGSFTHQSDLNKIHQKHIKKIQQRCSSHSCLPRPIIFKAQDNTSASLEVPASITSSEPYH